ncbi:hypothetical protein U9M48_007656, partial [Paspalum notatum var. saurae]
NCSGVDFTNFSTDGVPGRGDVPENMVSDNDIRLHRDDSYSTEHMETSGDLTTPEMHDICQGPAVATKRSDDAHAVPDANCNGDDDEGVIFEEYSTRMRDTNLRGKKRRLMRTMLLMELKMI